MRKGAVKRNHFQEEEGLKWKWKTIKSLVHRLRLRFRQSLILSIMFAFKIAFFLILHKTLCITDLVAIPDFGEWTNTHWTKGNALPKQICGPLFLTFGITTRSNTVCASSLARHFRNVSFRTAKSNTNRTIEMQFIWNRTRSFPELNKLHENLEGRKKIVSVTIKFETEK